MRRLLLLLLPVLAAPALAAAPAQAGGDHAKPTTAAVQPAAVKSTLQQVGDSVKGRLTSSRDACVDGRDVYLIFRYSDEDLPDIEYVTTTDANGRWALDARRRFRQVTLRLAALTLGGPRCDVAQSNQITYEPKLAGAAPSSGARLADVAITLQGRETQNIHGRITSSRSVCEKGRPVFAFVRSGGSDGFLPELIAISRNDGSYRINEGRRAGLQRGASIDVVTVVPGTNNCQPAQSRLLTYFV